MIKITIIVKGISKEALAELPDFLQYDRLALGKSPQELGHEHLQETDIDLLGEAIREAI